MVTVNSVVAAGRSRRVRRGGERGYRGRKVMDVGVEHMTQCTDDMLQNCAPDTCIILLASVNKKEKRKLEIKSLLKNLQK